MKQKPLAIVGLIFVGAVFGATVVSTVSTSDNGEDTSYSDPRDTLRKNLSKNSLNNEDTPPLAATPENLNLDDLNASLTALHESLQKEIDQRKKLETKLSLLEKRMAKNNNSDGSNGTSDNTTDNTGNPHQPSFGSAGNNWFNEQAMLDAGIDSAKVKYIKEAFEQAEMDKLYLRDQARREGWLNDKKYTDAAKEIADKTKELRNQLSENEYDAYLFAAGRANRVLVSSTLSTSPASNAGIQPGDTILEYDNQRIYSWSDLTSATSDGTPGDTVTVTIERDGQRQQVYIPRGPLGVRLATDSVAP